MYMLYDKTKTSVLNKCVSDYVHAIGLTRQREEGYIGSVCVDVHLMRLIRQRHVHQGYKGCIHVYIYVIGLRRERDQHYIHVYVSMYRL